MRIWVPLDAAAKAMGADEVAGALARALPDARITRNGTRGMIWLEPLVEVERGGVRHGYGPVAPEDAASVAEAIRSGGAHPLSLSFIEEMIEKTHADGVITLDPIPSADTISQLVERSGAHGCHRRFEHVAHAVDDLGCQPFARQ